MESALRNLLSFRTRVTELLRGGLEDLLLPRSRAFRSYERTWRRSLERPMLPAPGRALLRSILSADVLYLADFHPFPDARASAARWLKAVRSDGREIRFGMELFSPREDGLLVDWHERRIDGPTLCRESSAARRWGRTFRTYLPLLRFLRREGIPIHGLDPEAGTEGIGLHRRDRQAAERLVALRARHPGMLLVALYGEYHLAPRHLPAQVDEAAARACQARPRRVILLQDAEPLYWRHVEGAGEERGRLVRLGEDTFCLFNRSPAARLDAVRNAIGGAVGANADVASQVVAFLAAVSAYVEGPRVDSSRWTVLVGEEDRDAVLPHLLPADAREARMRVARTGRPVLDLHRGVLYLPEMRLEVLVQLAAGVVGGAPESASTRALAAFLLHALDPHAPRASAWKDADGRDAWKRGRRVYDTLRRGALDSRTAVRLLLASDGDEARQGERRDGVRPRGDAGTKDRRPARRRGARSRGRQRLSA